MIAGNSNPAGNRLNGGAGNDVIQGKGGTDVIIGGMGADELWGGGASDTFEFKLGDSHGSQLTFDTIKDFDLGDDVMRFQVYDPDKTSWSAREGIVDGVAGTWVTITEPHFEGAMFEEKVLHEVFLEGTALLDVAADDIELF